MKISIIAPECAKIYLSNDDMKRLDINQSGDTVCDELMLFVTGIAAFLTELGLIELNSSELTCSVSEVFDGIVAQIGDGGEKAERTLVLYTFADSGELCAFCGCIPITLLEKLGSSELYKVGTSYCLILEFGCSQTSLLSYKSMHGGSFDRVAVQKAREYGELISRTPIKTIRELKDL